jgi:hypothetical protein
MIDLRWVEQRNSVDTDQEDNRLEITLQWYKHSALGPRGMIVATTDAYPLLIGMWPTYPTRILYGVACGGPPLLFP